jgi:MFS family permease
MSLSSAAARIGLSRNVGLLALAQAFSQSVQTMAIATTPLAGHALLGVDKTLATLPLFLNHAALMMTTVPASLLMARIGRRGGFSIGAVLAILSGLTSTIAIFRQSFLLLCVGSLFQGAAIAFAWYYRFAAADAAEPPMRAKAISLVMAGGIVAGFLGPQTAKWAVDWLSPVIFAGVYLMVMVFGVIALMLVQGLRIPSLSAAEKAEGGRPLAEIARQPAYIVALLSSMFGFGVMTLIMSATPLAMLACGFKFNDGATVIQGHVIAMFLPAFFTGHLITRYGVLPIIATGAVLQLGCALINIAGIDFWNFFLANVLVGLGWNFTFTGGTTLLTQTYRPAERAKVQASHDFLVYSTTATAAGLSGILQAQAGWQLINVASIPLMAIVMAAAVWLMRRQAAEARLTPTS